MATNTKAVTFDNLLVGDELPSFEIDETQDTINGARLIEDHDQEIPRNIHTDPEFAKEGLFAGTVNAGITTMAYVNQMLEQWFPASNLYDGGRLEFKAIDPFRPGDTVTFTGKIAGKREENGKKIVDCKIEGHNQLGKIMGVAEATLVLQE
jgi:acyl dehydratase